MTTDAAVIILAIVTAVISINHLILSYRVARLSMRLDKITERCPHGMHWDECPVCSH